MVVFPLESEEKEKWMGGEGGYSWRVCRAEQFFISRGGGDYTSANINTHLIL